MLEFSVLLNELVKRNRHQRKDAFADPLEGPEWEGLHWVLALFDRLQQTDRKKATPRDRGIAPGRTKSSFSNNQVQCVVAR